MSVIFKMPKQQIVIPAAEVDKLKAVSRFVADALEFSDMGDDDKEFPIAITEDFDEESVVDAIRYLKETNYQPTHYKKAPLGELHVELSSEVEKQLAAKYKSIPSIRKLHSAAKYLQIKALETFALILIAVQFLVNVNQHDSLEKVKARWGITTNYDINVEREIKLKYAHLAGYGN